jgi:hypothetical protein
MKYMNHLRKLALLSSLALSFSVAVKADGTLPLPLEMTDPAVELTLAVTTLDIQPRMPFETNGVKACAPSDVAYTATGEVVHGFDEYEIVGVCIPKVGTSKRTIVTTDKQATRYTILEGTADDTAKFSTFTGVLSHKLFMTPSPVVAGPEAETAAALKPVRFILRRP